MMKFEWKKNLSKAGKVFAVGSVTALITYWSDAQHLEELVGPVLAVFALSAMESLRNWWKNRNLGKPAEQPVRREFR